LGVAFNLLTEEQRDAFFNDTEVASLIQSIDEYDEVCKEIYGFGHEELEEEDEEKEDEEDEEDEEDDFFDDLDEEDE
jgi:hypothetical protein